VNRMNVKVPKEIESKYPRTSEMKFPDGSVETVKVPKGYFVSDHNEEREYWKGFEIIEWKDGEKELRVCYWTRKKGTEKWIWGQYATIISYDKLKQLLTIAERDFS
jgi:hypothetical protein